MSEYDITTLEGRAKLREICDNATPAPWKWHHEDSSMIILSVNNNFIENTILWCTRCKACREKNLTNFRCGWPKTEDAKFISTARAALPRALDRIDQLEAELMRTKNQKELKGLEIKDVLV